MSHFAQAQFSGNSFGAQRRQDKALMDRYKDGRADGKQMRSYLGYEAGAFFSFAQRSFVATAPYTDENGIFQGEKTHTQKLKPWFLGFAVGTYIPLSNLSPKSSVALDFGVNVTMWKGKTGSFYLADSMRRAHYNSDFFLWQFGLPIMLDFKYGGEAIYDKGEAFSFTLGAGLQPAVSTGAVMRTDKLRGTISPVIKAEIGFFALVQWKIKATYLGQTGDVYRVSSGNVGMESKPDGTTFRLTTTPAINLGISFMPFSYDWDSSRW
ncbi:MAG: hypothetical protein EOP49_10305 [Sphingobacteriales bacterium]|nr:MAG: hypothetical protein EOP49_10305 [Sphingobacteriales bacterium]